jgi:hypothetical protein
MQSARRKAQDAGCRVNKTPLSAIRYLLSAICYLLPATCYLLPPNALAQTPSGNGLVTLARLQYGGGGDWYNDPDELVNLAREINRRTNIACHPEQAVVELTDDKLFNYPFLYITGHGNIKFTDAEVERLRTFLANGGFLYADDDYGMDQSFRRELARVLPDNSLVELPYDHAIYHMVYDFPEGLPKIHEHAEGPPKGFGIYYQDRMVVFYTWNTNISDGWSDVHNDSLAKREAAFKTGVNIVSYALTH